MNGYGLEAAGVKLSENRKIIVNDDDSTTTSNIFSIGEVAEGRPEFSSTSILAGKLLAQRLFAKSKKMMDYQHIPSTIFTPIEYSCIGYSEEAAKQKYG